MVRYTDRAEWVNEHYVGKKCFPNGNVTQDAVGEMSDKTDGSGNKINLDDGENTLRYRERMGTITQEADQNSEIQIIVESTSDEGEE